MDVLVCHSFDEGVAEKKYPREAKTILVGSTVQYLAGTKIRAQPGAPNHKALFKTDIDVKEWQLVPCQRNLPLQTNGKNYGLHPICTLLILLLTSVDELIGYDRGVFLCMYADFISNDNPIIFTHSEIGVCWERIALSIMINMTLD